MLVLREFEGLSYREIAQKMDMTRPAVESALFRARRRLQQEYARAEAVA
ncbi:MAG: sigma factor-like helix-turn-helix DNA-binding protein [Thermoleophilaceae bacterium]